jgi:hypothetical protein
VSNLRECEVAEQFLDNPNEDSFAAVFRTFTPQLVAFFRRRGHKTVPAEDLAQEVMLTVYRKAGQIRDRSLFRAWLLSAPHRVPALCPAHSGSADGRSGRCRRAACSHTPP